MTDAVTWGRRLDVIASSRTQREAAERLGVSTKTVRRWVCDNPQRARAAYHLALWALHDVIDRGMPAAAWGDVETVQRYYADVEAARDRWILSWYPRQTYWVRGRIYGPPGRDPNWTRRYCPGCRAMVWARWSVDMPCLYCGRSCGEHHRPRPVNTGAREMRKLSGD